jgi:hypothetical protein
MNHTFCLISSGIILNNYGECFSNNYAHQCHRTYQWNLTGLMQQSATVSTLTDNCFSYLDCVLLYGLTSLQMYTVRKFSIYYFTKPDASLKNMWVLKKEPHWLVLILTLSLNNSLKKIMMLKFVEWTESYMFISCKILGFTSVTMKNVVSWNIKTQFIPQRKNITFPLQSPAG